MRSERRSTWGLIVGAFSIVVALEFSTPPAYVFGYLYTGPILLVNSRLSARATFQVTLTACVLTILNLFIPELKMSAPATVANRLIVVIALVITTGWLSNRNRRNEEAAQQQAQLQAADKLASIREDFFSTLTHDLKTPILGAIETSRICQSISA